MISKIRSEKNVLYLKDFLDNNVELSVTYFVQKLKRIF